MDENEKPNLDFDGTKKCDCSTVRRKLIINLILDRQACNPVVRSFWRCQECGFTHIRTWQKNREAPPVIDFVQN